MLFCSDVNLKKITKNFVKKKVCFVVCFFLQNFEIFISLRRDLFLLIFSVKSNFNSKKSKKNSKIYNIWFLFSYLKITNYQKWPLFGNTQKNLWVCCLYDQKITWDNFVCSLSVVTKFLFFIRSTLSSIFKNKTMFTHHSSHRIFSRIFFSCWK